MSKIRSPVVPPLADINNENDSNRVFVIFEIVDPNDIGLQWTFEDIPPLFMHVNPDSLAESYRKIINRDYTRAGHVEYHWGEELDSISASGSTGAFISPGVGLANLNRRATIAWQRWDDLFSLYKNNGNFYDSAGAIVFHGGVRMLYDGAFFEGYFTTFSTDNTVEQPFMFNMSWTFKVEQQNREIGR